MDSIRHYLWTDRPDTGKCYLLVKLAQLPECKPDTLLACGQYWYDYTVKKGVQAGRPEALYAIGLALYRKGKSSDAIGYLYRAATAWEENGRDPLQLARTYELVAAVYKTLQKPADALPYYRQAYALKKTQDNEAILLSTYNGLGTTFRALGLTDSAIFYLKKALAAAGNELTKAQVTNNLGNIYWSLKEWPTASQWYGEALQHFEATHHPGGIAEANFNMGAVATQLQQYPAAIRYYNKSLESLPTGQSLEHLEWIYQHLADACYHTGAFKAAYENEIKYNKIRDSTLSLAVQRSVADMKEKYETEKKEHALMLEKERTARLSLINSNNERLIYLLAGVAILVSALGYFMVRNMRRKQVLAAQVAALKEKQNQQLIREQALKNNIAMLEGQERERQRISRDLHDRLGTTLTSVKLYVQSSRVYPDGIAEHARKIDLLLDEAVNDIRGISHDMSPAILQKYGLVEAVKDLKDTAEAGGTMRVRLQLRDAGLLPAGAAAEVYYILKELLHNAVKHSGADELFIQLMEEDRIVYLTVEDNGTGFDRTAITHGIGLTNIEARVHKLNAVFTIDSYPGKGTCFSFTIPLK